MKIKIMLLLLGTIILCSCNQNVTEVTGNNGCGTILKVGSKEYKILKIKPNRDNAFYLLVPKDTTVELTTEQYAPINNNNTTVIKLD